MKPMMQELKQNKYENAIKIAVQGSILEEKKINDEKTKSDLISQIETLHKHYGNFVDFGKVYETTLGKIGKGRTILIVRTYCDVFGQLV
jgi:hypothetical protein